MTTCIIEPFANCELSNGKSPNSVTKGTQMTADPVVECFVGTVNCSILKNDLNRNNYRLRGKHTGSNGYLTV